MRPQDKLWFMGMVASFLVWFGSRYILRTDRWTEIFRSTADTCMRKMPAGTCMNFVIERWYCTIWQLSQHPYTMHDKWSILSDSNSSGSLSHGVWAEIYWTFPQGFFLWWPVHSISTSAIYIQLSSCSADGSWNPCCCGLCLCNLQSQEIPITYFAVSQNCILAALVSHIHFPFPDFYNWVCAVL